ncbi:MAG: hypothetical protein F2811_00870 [Actinobacteria bacterium]|nr:hypothetical protein [Actinomycetota bacterium]
MKGSSQSTASSVPMAAMLLGVRQRRRRAR